MSAEKSEERVIPDLESFSGKQRVFIENEARICINEFSLIADNTNLRLWNFFFTKSYTDLTIILSKTKEKYEVRAFLKILLQIFRIYTVGIINSLINLFFEYLLLNTI